MNINKSDHLDNILRELKSIVVAYSGGVDSTFLLHRANSIKNLNVIGVTVSTPFIPAYEINEAIEIAGKYGFNHTIIDLALPEIIRSNPPDRCYFCKKYLFSAIIDFAAEKGYKYVVDGSNADDTDDYRPGLKALRELSISSPLLDAGLTKNEIREMARKEGLSIWDKPAMACLLTRIPYNTVVSNSTLKMIEKAESYLMEHGYPGTRVRIHGDLARIECLPGYIHRIAGSPDREEIISSMKKIGFRYVSLDLEGYRSGSFNPEQ